MPTWHTSGNSHQHSSTQHAAKTLQSSAGKQQRKTTAQIEKTTDAFAKQEASLIAEAVLFY